MNGILQRYGVDLSRDRVRVLVFLGVLGGLTAFWNGSAVISLVLIVSALAALLRRWELLLVPVIAVVLTQLQSWFFVGTESPVSPSLHIGFLAEESSLRGILSYYFELLGLFPIVFAFALALVSPHLRRWGIAFLAPFIFANIVQLSPELNINHKFINVSVFLGSIFVAFVLVRALFGQTGVFLKAVAGVALVGLTLSGVIDFFGLWNVNERTQAYRVDHPLTMWARAHTEPDAVFVSSPAMYRPELWAGRAEFTGWPYFVASAGYDSTHRTRVVRDIYAGRSVEAVRSLMRSNGIDYVVVDGAVRENRRIRVNERVLSAALDRVFYDASSGVSVYGLE